MSEFHEQAALIQWCQVAKAKYPELDLLFAIPNGGSRNTIEAVNLKRSGVRKGVPDLFLPVARGGFFGLFIEMKRKEGERSQVSAEQRKFASDVAAQGYLTVFCFGWESAQKSLVSYLQGDPTPRSIA